MIQNTQKSWTKKVPPDSFVICLLEAHESFIYLLIYICIIYILEHNKRFNEGFLFYTDKQEKSRCWVKVVFIVYNLSTVTSAHIIVLFSSHSLVLLRRRLHITVGCLKMKQRERKRRREEKEKCKPDWIRKGPVFPLHVNAPLHQNR